MATTKLTDLSSRPSTQVIQVPKLPSLHDEMMSYGFKEGARRFDEQAEQWRQQLEQKINQLARPQDVQAGPG